MAMFRMWIGELQQMQHGAHSARRADGARLQRRLRRTEIGLAVVALGAAAMFLDAATRLSAFTG